MKSQKEQILELLERRGYNGVKSFEFYEMYIPRGAARICDLRKEGYDIKNRRGTRRGEVIYYLAKFEKNQFSFNLPCGL